MSIAVHAYVSSLFTHAGRGAGTLWHPARGPTEFDENRVQSQQADQLNGRQSQSLHEFLPCARELSFAQCHHEEKLADAVDKLERLVQQGCFVDSSALYRLIKRCIAQKDLDLGSRIHAVCLQNGSQSDLFLANHIIRMYASHGKLQEASQVFSGVAAPDTFMWASIICAHVQHGEPAQAIHLYRQMQSSDVKPNSYVYVAALKACAAAVNLDAGRAIHADILQDDVLHRDVFLGSSLVDMYSKCGSLVDARTVFDQLSPKNVVTWTAMIAGYTHHGLGQEALALYASMLQDGITPADRVTFVCLLQACAAAGGLQQGKLLHSQLRERGLEAALGSALVDMYSKCGSVEDARRVFDSLPVRKDVVTWTAMIAGYAQHGLGYEALAVHASMQQYGVAPNHVTFVCLLQACASVRAVNEGRQVHLRIQRSGVQVDAVMGNCLMDMYAKCDSLEDARRVFDELPDKDVVAWTTMIRAYAQHGFGGEALELYSRMQQEGMTPADEVVFACLLQACTSVGALSQGRQLHAQIRERGLEGNVVVGTCLVDMYAKCGALLCARQVFDRLPVKNVVIWTAMIAAYVHDGRGQDALALYASMQQVGVNPANCITFVCLLQACASVGALRQGEQLHSEIRQQGLDMDLVIGNCLVVMYAKCGRLGDARCVLDGLRSRDVVTWTALLNGYAEHGDSRMAMQCFQEMLQEGVRPDEATFVCLLVACSHDGLVCQGQHYFTTMVEDHGITPTVQHYNCMVDLLARSGRLEDAENVLCNNTPVTSDDAVGWTALLSACKIHGDIERGRRCFENIVKVDPENATAYVLLANLFANAGMWEDVDSVEELRRCAGAKRKPAKACIEVQERVFEFTVGAEETPGISRKSRAVNLTLKQEGGHVPHTELVLNAVPQVDKEDALCGHAEKLALVYGLLNTAEGATLLVTKNLRMCNNCHSGTKVMSRLEQREIIVRDAHRVHHFKDGYCSCRDRP